MKYAVTKKFEGNDISSNDISPLLYFVIILFCTRSVSLRSRFLLFISRVLAAGDIFYALRTLIRAATAFLRGWVPRFSGGNSSDVFHTHA